MALGAILVRLFASTIRSDAILYDDMNTPCYRRVFEGT